MNVTESEWVAGVAGATGAHGQVIHWGAIGVLAASAGTRVATLVSQAHLRGGAIGVYNALGTTSLVGVA